VRQQCPISSGWCSATRRPSSPSPATDMSVVGAAWTSVWRGHRRRLPRDRRARRRPGNGALPAGSTAEGAAQRTPAHTLPARGQKSPNLPQTRTVCPIGDQQSPGWGRSWIASGRRRRRGDPRIPYSSIFARLGAGSGGRVLSGPDFEANWSWAVAAVQLAPQQAVVSYGESRPQAGRAACRRGYPQR
jgi:hypothetical protein